jgi:putative ABC transport system permease protein
MFKNYFLTAWRNLWKSKGFTLLNVAGLAIGMAACIMIMLFVSYERSFDSMHTKNIYRLDEVQKFPGMVAPQNVALSMFPMGPTLKNEFPEVKNFTRVRNNQKMELFNGSKKITIPQVLCVDSTFLNIFNFELVTGEKDHVLERPNSIVLTETTASKIFGKESPLGKTLLRYANDTISLTVTGIIKDAPKNSHLQFDALFSFSTIYRPQMMENWGGNWLVTYLELSKDANTASMEKRFPAYLARHMDERGRTFYELFLQPLKDVHAKSASITHDYLNFSKFDGSYTYIFGVIAIIVLVIACINFMNLSTARSAGRAKEVGVRKSIGAHRYQLGMQFLGESVMLCFIALLLAVLLVKLSIPYLNNLSDRQLEFPFFTSPLLIGGLLLGVIVVGVFAGLYPAAYLSSFQASRVLKGSPQTGRAKSNFRNILVVGQFSGAIVLIIATVFAVKQLNFMRDKDPGFTREQVVLIPLNNKTSPNYDAFKQALLRNNLILGVTASQQRLGNNLHQTGIRFHGDGPVQEMATSQVIVDPDYLTLYKIPIIAGSNFSGHYETENGKTYIINESLAKELLKDAPKDKQNAYESLIGKMFGFGGLDSSGKIVGVAKDFNFNSFHHKIETLCIFNQKDWGYGEVSIKISPAKTNQAIDFIQSTWNRLNSGHDFEYSFLDDHFASLYKADGTVSEVVGILAVLAIIISCLGLLGLSSYAAEKRTREVGIRKVLGASVQNLVTLLSVDFLKLVLIANIIAWPIAWFVLDKWLEDFAYRININLWIFLLAGVAAIAIALLTICFQAIRAALMNPVKSLRIE